MIYEEGNLEDDFAVHCQYSDGCADGIWHDIVHGTRSTGAALGARWWHKRKRGNLRGCSALCYISHRAV